TNRRGKTTVDINETPWRNGNNKVHNENRFFRNMENRKEAPVINRKKKYHENRLPGFRSGKIVNMVLAGFWYFFICFGQTVYDNGFTLKEFFDNLGVGILLFGYTLLFANYRNLQGRMPLIKKNKKAGLILYSVIIFLICGLLMELGKF
ncbi:MAG: hypothetical protein ACRC2K_06110, partial [Clostridium sp.]